jgi:hypothetical protein
VTPLTAVAGLFRTATLPFAEALADTHAPGYHFARPFLQPLPIWDYWPWLLLPLCVAVAVVYKSIKCRHMRQVPKEAGVLTLYILGGMAGAAAALAVVVKLIEKSQS